MEHLSPDWHDDLLLRIWRTYLLLEELESGPQTAEREAEIRAVHDTQASAFLAFRRR